MSGNNISGRLGEEAAAKYLAQNGYKIIKRNYKSRNSEIDIVATDGNILCFVEVKTRRSKDFGYAAEAVDFYKRQKICLELFIRRNNSGCSGGFGCLRFSFRPFQKEFFKSSRSV